LSAVTSFRPSLTSSRLAHTNAHTFGLQASSRDRRSEVREKRNFWTCLFSKSCHEWFRQNRSKQTGPAHYVQKTRSKEHNSLDTDFYMIETKQSKSDVTAQQIFFLFGKKQLEIKIQIDDKNTY